MLRNCLTTGALCATGDVLSQLLDSSQTYNPASTLRNGAYGLCVFGPIGHRLYPALNMINPFKSSKANTITRVAVDQLVWSPIGVALYLSAISVMENRPFKDIKTKLNHVYWNVLITNWQVWPLFQFVNFTLIPVQNRLLAVNIASIGWNCYLSWKNRHSLEAIP